MLWIINNLNLSSTLEALEELCVDGKYHLLLLFNSHLKEGNFCEPLGKNVFILKLILELQPKISLRGQTVTMFMFIFSWIKVHSPKTAAMHY